MAFTGGTANFSGIYSGDTTTISGGTVNFNRPYTGATTNVSGGRANFNQLYTGTTTNVSGGIADFNGGGSTAVFNLSGGTLDGGPSTLVVNGPQPSSWTGGTLAARVLLDSNATLEKSGGGIVRLSGRLANAGTVKLSGGQITVATSAELRNSGTFEFAGDVTVAGPGLFTNDGTVSKTAGTGTATLGVPLLGPIGSADWRVDAGTLNLTGGSHGNNTGVQNVNAGAGTLAFHAGTFNMAGLTAAPGSTVAFTGGTANFGALSLSGTVNVNSGTVTLNAPTTNSGVLNVAAGATILTNNASLTNTSTGVLAGSGSVSMSGTTPGTILNNGVIAPGGAGAAGTLSVLGNVSFGATGSLNAERFSNTSFDKLAVSGNAALAGTFGLTNAAPLLLSDGSFYSVLTYGSKTGTFTTVNLPAPYFAFYLTDRLNVTAFNLASPIGGTVKQTANQVVSNMGTILNPPQTTTGTASSQSTIGTGSPTLPKCGATKLKALVACTP